jgi:hypothetical protein
VPWESVAHAVRSKRAKERWFVASLALGIALVVLVVPILLASAGNVQGDALVEGVGTYVVSLLPLLAMLAAAMDPVDAPGESRLARVAGAHVGTLAVTTTPALLAIGVGLFLALLATGTLAAGIGPLVTLLIGAGLAASAGSAIGLAVTARSRSLASAVVAVVVAYLSLTVLMGLAASTASAVFPRGRSVASFVLFLLTPPLLARAYIVIGTPFDFEGRSLGDVPAALYSPAVLFLALALWTFVPLAVACVWMDDAAPPPAFPPQASPPPTAPQPAAPPPDVTPPAPPSEPEQPPA